MVQLSQAGEIRDSIQFNTEDDTPIHESLNNVEVWLNGVVLETGRKTQGTVIDLNRSNQ